MNTELFLSILSVAVCEALGIQNGMVRIPGDISCIKSGTVATHLCNMNFFLDGNQERTCMGNGFWSGVVPVCRGIVDMLKYIIF